MVYGRPVPSSDDPVTPALALVERYCASRVHEGLREQIRIECSRRGRAITTLHAADRRGRWFRYGDVGPAPHVAILLGEVEDDPTGIFWG
jgi:hypothetical protein